MLNSVSRIQICAPNFWANIKTIQRQIGIAICWNGREKMPNYFCFQVLDLIFSGQTICDSFATKLRHKINNAKQIGMNPVGMCYIFAGFISMVSFIPAIWSLNRPSDLNFPEFLLHRFLSVSSNFSIHFEALEVQWSQFGSNPEHNAALLQWWNYMLMVPYGIEWNALPQTIQNRWLKTEIIITLAWFFAEVDDDDDEEPEHCCSRSSIALGVISIRYRSEWVFCVYASSALWLPHV